jgi:hypothetical protein
VQQLVAHPLHQRSLWPFAMFRKISGNSAHLESGSTRSPHPSRKSDSPISLAPKATMIRSKGYSLQTLEIGSRY